MLPHTCIKLCAPRNCLGQLGESLSLTHRGQWWAPHLKKQKHLRRTSFETKVIFSCAMKPALGRQPNHSLLPEVTHTCHKSESFHQGAQGVTAHRLGCCQCQGQGVWMQAVPLTQIYHSQQEGHTQSVSMAYHKQTPATVPTKTKQDWDQRFLPQSSYLPHARESLYNIPENTAGCKLVLNKCDETKECWSLSFWGMLY